MRVPVLLLMCFSLFACGKTGALYLPEEAVEAPQQNTQVQPQENTSEENAD